MEYGRWGRRCFCDVAHGERCIEGALPSLAELCATCHMSDGHPRGRARRRPRRTVSATVTRWRRFWRGVRGRGVNGSAAERRRGSTCCGGRRRCAHGGGHLCDAGVRHPAGRRAGRSGGARRAVDLLGVALCGVVLCGVVLCGVDMLVTFQTRWRGWTGGRRLGRRVGRWEPAWSDPGWKRRRRNRKRVDGGGGRCGMCSTSTNGWRGTSSGRWESWRGTSNGWWGGWWGSCVEGGRGRGRRRQRRHAGAAQSRPPRALPGIARAARLAAGRSSGLCGEEGG